MNFTPRSLGKIRARTAPPARNARAGEGGPASRARGRSLADPTAAGYKIQPHTAFTLLLAAGSKSIRSAPFRYIGACVSVPLLAYSIKIYDFYTDKSAAQIKKIWASTAAANADAWKRASPAGTAGGSFQVRHSIGILNYDFTILPRNNILVLHGPGPGRVAAANRLAADIGGARRRDVIVERTLDTDDMMRVFRNIVKEDNGNIIQALTMFFEPHVGFRYSRETYTEISYRFVENRCASKHVDFARLHKNSKAMNMVLLIDRCVGINEEDWAARLDAKWQCTFRMYRDVEAGGWDAFCSKILGFLWE